MKNFQNYTPHAIKLNDGTVFEPTWTIARVTVDFVPFDEDGITKQVFGVVEWLPEATQNTIIIVSGMVLSALQWSREDVVAPATGHKDVIRNEKNQIESVPWFTR